MDKMRDLIKGSNFLRTLNYQLIHAPNATIPSVAAGLKSVKVLKIGISGISLS